MNTNESSVCGGGNAALCQLTFTTYLVRVNEITARTLLTEVAISYSVKTGDNFFQKDDSDLCKREFGDAAATRARKLIEGTMFSLRALFNGCCCRCFCRCRKS